MKEYLPQFEQFERALLDDRAMVEQLLRELPPVLEPERITVQDDVVSVDQGIARAAALALLGVEPPLVVGKMMNTAQDKSNSCRNDAALPPRVNGGSHGRNAQPPDATAWPDPPAEEALYGLPGEIVRTIEPHSESDPAALLAQTLIVFGNVIGNGPFYRVESDLHRTNLNALLVGATGKGRKGTSKGRVLEAFVLADEGWLKTRINSGLSSGEGLVWSCRDRIEKQVAIREKGRIIGYETEEIDPGVSDKRLLAIESEFARVLKMASREGNVLSEAVREAWDSGNLRNMTKNSPAVATGAHISIIGHITRDELIRNLSETEQANGFGNRFIWLAVRRSKYLPREDDRRIDSTVMKDLQEKVRETVASASKIREMQRDDQAEAAWCAVYGDGITPGLSDGRPGLLGAMLGRAEAQVLRLSMIYALADGIDRIGLPHLKAALAMWEYSERSARYIFGGRLGDPAADVILDALRDSPRGLTRTDISALLGRNKPAGEISRALGTLSSLGLARCQREETAGRSSERWTAA